jgi:hypothetical protein
MGITIMTERALSSKNHAPRACEGLSALLRSRRRKNERSRERHKKKDELSKAVRST